MCLWQRFPVANLWNFIFFRQYVAYLLKPSQMRWTHNADLVMFYFLLTAMLWLLRYLFIEVNYIHSYISTFEILISVPSSNCFCHIFPYVKYHTIRQKKKNSSSFYCCNKCYIEIRIILNAHQQCLFPCTCWSTANLNIWLILATKVFLLLLTVSKMIGRK